LNDHGGQQEYGVNCWENFALVVQWTAIRLIMTLTFIKGWHTRQLDFRLAYPKQRWKVIIHEAAQGFSLSGKCSRKTHVLKLFKKSMD